MLALILLFNYIHSLTINDATYGFSSDAERSTENTMSSVLPSGRRLNPGACGSMNCKFHNLQASWDEDNFEDKGGLSGFNPIYSGNSGFGGLYGNGYGGLTTYILGGYGNGYGSFYGNGPLLVSSSDKSTQRYNNLSIPFNKKIGYGNGYEGLFGNGLGVGFMKNRRLTNLSTATDFFGGPFTNLY